MSLIACPGCQHRLTLPEDFVGQRVQCPKCLIEFEANATLVPAMEVDPPIPPAILPESVPSPPLLQTAYASVAAPTSRPSIFCIRCGSKCAATDDACPACGCPTHDLYDELPRSPRRPRLRALTPIRGSLPIIAAILLPVGVAIIIATVILAEEVFRGPRGTRLVLTLIGCGVGGLVELTACVLILIWLYQAWRLISREDEEYSPGLRVGLLLVPFFNFYWMFHAIPGLSAAIQRETKVFAPTRAGTCGWVPGLAACIIILIPWGQPIAICIFIAWMLIANNALHRFMRLHEEARADDTRRRAEVPER